jgi:hypothetical protein
VEAAFVAIGTVHRLMSFHDEESDVSRLNRGAYETAIRVHPWTFEVLEIALDLHGQSNGMFDIRIAPALQKLGLLPYHGGDLAWDAPLTSGHGEIELLAGQCVRFRDRATRIDLGGIAKGFAVDRAIGALRNHGMPSGLVNAGGDLAAFGPRGLIITVRDPACPKPGLAPGRTARRGDRFKRRRVRSFAFLAYGTPGDHRSRQRGANLHGHWRNGAGAVLHSGRRSDEDCHDRGRSLGVLAPPIRRERPFRGGGRRCPHQLRVARCCRSGGLSRVSPGNCTPSCSQNRA